MAKGKPMNLIEYADREMLVLQVANILAGDLENALFNHDRVSFAVPGGTTPGPIFDMLCATDHLDWSRVDVMLSDERWVPEDDPQSNAALIKQRLMTGHAAEATFTPFFTADHSIEAASAQLGETLKDAFPLSVLMLGMGADMHTASLFPGAEGLEAAMASDAPVFCPIKMPGAQPDRITLTARMLEGAMSTHVVIFGEDKKEALKRAQSLSAAEAPIKTVLANAQVHWAA